MKKFYSIISLMLACTCSAFAQEASYDFPTALRYLGTIKNPDPQPVCLFTTKNPMNNKAYMWAPMGCTMKYTDTSTGSPLSWAWEAEGGEIANSSSQDALITYSTVGTFSMPKLSVGYFSGGKEYQPEEKIKIGGTAELCLADCRKWAESYAWGYIDYKPDAQGNSQGYLGGTNTLDILGVGNLYMLSAEDGYIDGVNVYLSHKPTKWQTDAKIGVRVWMASITQEGVLLNYLPLEGDEIKFEDIKGEEDGVWVPIDGGAVVQMKCTEPVDLYGKPFIFIDVFGWSNDPKTEDFRMLMDVMPNMQMQPEDAQNMLAHNSFVRIKGESEYLRPVSYFGGNYGSFMICPIVRGAETPLASISMVKNTRNQSLTCAINNGVITLEGADANVMIYNVAGQACHSGAIVNGTYTFNASLLAPGIYVARTSAGETAKFAVK